MGRYGFLLKRPFQLIPVLIGISLITFLLLQMTPGDPVRLMLGPKASPEAIEFVRARYGLDRPVMVQYFYSTPPMRPRVISGESIAYRSPGRPGDPQPDPADRISRSSTASRSRC